MLNPHGTKDIRAIHYDNRDRFEEVEKRLADAEQGKLVRADKDNVYNNLLFSFCEQMKSYVDTMEYNAQTQHYQNSQTYVNDLEVRGMMRDLLSETINKMKEINEQYQGQPYKPFDKDIIRLGEAIATNNGQSLQQSIVDMYATIKKMDQSCEQCQQELRQRFEAESKAFNKTYKDKSTLARDADDYRNALRSIADTKLMFKHILKPALAALNNQTINETWAHVPEHFKLSREEQEKFDDITKTVNDRVDYIGKHEKSHYYSTDLTPDGYLYSRSHVVESGAGKLEYQQQKTLFDRHLHEKQTELGFNTFIKVNWPTNDPNMKCEISIPIPNGIDDRKIVLTKNREDRDAMRQLLQFHEAYKSGADIGEDLAKYVMNISEEGYIPDDLDFIDVAEKLMDSLKGFAQDTTVRFHGTAHGKEVDETVKLPDAIVYKTKNEHLVNLKIAIDDKMRDKKDYAKDWIDSKKNVKQDMRIDSVKNIGKNGIGVGWDYIKMQARIYAGRADKAIKDFADDIASRTKKVFNDLLKTHQISRDLDNGGQIPLDKLTTLSQQAERTNDLYADVMFREDLRAGIAEQQEENTLQLESVGLSSPFDNAQVRELEDNQIEITFFEDRFGAQAQQPMFDGHIDMDVNGVSHVPTDDAEINNEIEEGLTIDR